MNFLWAKTGNEESILLIATLWGLFVRTCTIAHASAETMSLARGRSATVFPVVPAHVQLSKSNHVKGSPVASEMHMRAWRRG